MRDVYTIGLQYIVIIADQKQKKKLLNLLYDYDTKCVDIIYGRGSMSPSAIAAAFGFDTEQGKVVISGLLPNEKAKNLMETLINDYSFGKPNTGIAYTVSVEGIAF